MANVLRNPYSNTAGNVPSSLGNGQIAVNQADGKLFYRASNGTVTQFSSGGGSSSVAVYASVSAFPATGSESVLYLAEDTSRLYQWESTVYAEVGGSGGGVTHASTHATGGDDPITASSIGAAAASHAHAAGDITSGTIADARLSANVVLTGDSRLSDSRTPTDGGVTDAKITSGGLSTSSLNWAAIQPWAANTAYAKGDLVSNAGIAYRRSAAGTSGSTFNIANWQQITPSAFLASQITSGTLDQSRLDFVPLHPFLLMGG